MLQGTTHIDELSCAKCGEGRYWNPVTGHCGACESRDRKAAQAEADLIYRTKKKAEDREAMYVANRRLREAMVSLQEAQRLYRQAVERVLSHYDE